MYPRAYNLGGRVYSNSWGLANTNGNSRYTADTDRYLYENQNFVIFFAAGNDGNGQNTILAPSNSKNVVAVGATSNDVATPALEEFSARGPAFDGRIKPDIVTAGSYVFSAQSSSSGEFHCAVVGMKGTSMATPIASGNANLLIEYFQRGFYPLGYQNNNLKLTPMGSLIKALMIHSGDEV